MTAAVAACVATPNFFSSPVSVASSHSGSLPQWPHHQHHDPYPTPPHDYPSEHMSGSGGSLAAGYGVSLPAAVSILDEIGLSSSSSGLSTPSADRDRTSTDKDRFVDGLLGTSD
jgi:hypothetical protein